MDTSPHTPKKSHYLPNLLWILAGLLVTVFIIGYLLELPLSLLLAIEAVGFASIAGILLAKYSRRFPS